MGPLKNAILIAGPTASGKSALALDFARQTGGIVVNADSMQVYGVLRVLTARPGKEELSAAPHRLYGHVDPRVAYSTGAYARDVARLVREGEFTQRPAIFVGGTGLYFRALLEGLSRMPSVSPAIREKWRTALREQGAAALHERLRTHDPRAAETIGGTDGQRIVRALEVFEASGRPLSEWQSAAGSPLVDPHSARRLVIEPERSLLVRRIDRRFDAMIEGGALEEVRAIEAMDIGDELPAMKAIGVRELLAAGRGELSLPDAVEKAKIATRQYAKRQSTWFRNQLGPEWERISIRD